MCPRGTPRWTPRPLLTIPVLQSPCGPPQASGGPGQGILRREPRPCARPVVHAMPCHGTGPSPAPLMTVMSGFDRWQVEIQLSCSANLELQEYRVDVVTGDVKHASTNANVHIAVRSAASRPQCPRIAAWHRGAQLKGRAGGRAEGRVLEYSRRAGGRAGGRDGGSARRVGRGRRCRQAEARPRWPLLCRLTQVPARPWPRAAATGAPAPIRFAPKSCGALRRRRRVPTRPVPAARRVVAFLTAISARTPSTRVPSSGIPGTRVRPSPTSVRRRSSSAPTGSRRARARSSARTIRTSSAERRQKRVSTLPPARAGGPGERPPPGAPPRVACAPHACVGRRGDRRRRGSSRGAPVVSVLSLSERMGCLCR
jgi:hypothetical protein